MTDEEVLEWAYAYENNPNVARWKGVPSNHGDLRRWSRPPGATLDQMNNLVDEGWAEKEAKSTQQTYLLTEKANKRMFQRKMEEAWERVPAKTIFDSMDLIVGFDDLKWGIARSISNQKRVHYLLEGPPASAKSLILEAIRTIVPGAYLTFGSRTSASGLAEILFENKPMILLMDEADKMRMDTFSVLLGLMETGEIIEAKHGDHRGIKLEKTAVIAACNKSTKMPPEFISRFALHAHFPHYNRDEFIAICESILQRAGNCPPELATYIGVQIFDRRLGDVRKARQIWDQMTEPSMAAADEVIKLGVVYSAENRGRRPKWLLAEDPAQSKLL